MNIFSAFEDRVSSIFGQTKDGMTSPLSFKKLARKAVKKMRDEVLVVDGVDTAPALYTILISAQDDAIMRSMYPEITSETAQFLKAKAREKGYSFVGEPLVRFMVDPALRGSKFAVFAENVDRRALERLRAEEEAFLNGSSMVGGAALTEKPAVTPPPQTPRFATISETDAGLNVIPESVMSQDMPGVNSELQHVPLVSNVPLVNSIAPATQKRPVPQSDYKPARMRQTMPSEIPVAAPEVMCMLIDRSTGQTYTARSNSTIIGRERKSANIVLRDSNVSRKHAELYWDGSWHIRDLGSTNGTQVNDFDIDTYDLHNGDTITLGLITLEFREG